MTELGTNTLQCNSNQDCGSWAELKWGFWAVGRSVAGCTRWGWSGPLNLIHALKALTWCVYLEEIVSRLSKMLGWLV